MSITLATMSSEYVGLAWKFHVSPVSCDNHEYYEQYLRLCALADRKSGTALTHILVDDGAQRIVGYISLRATSLVGDGAADKKTVHPALEIAELAVDEDYERNGYGSDLVNIALDYALEMRSKYMGIKYVMLCADPKAVGFYEKLYFGKVGDLYEALHDGWNDHCEPMYIQLPELG